MLELSNYSNNGQASFMKQATLMAVLEVCIGLRNKLINEEMKRLAALYGIKNA
jgi:hypothetical protein